MKLPSIMICTASLMITGCGSDNNVTHSSKPKSADIPVTLSDANQPIQFDIHTDYQNLLDQVVEAGLTGVSVHIATPGWSSTYTSGLANKDTNEPLKPGHLFRIASNTKSFVSTLAHLMAQQGQIDLDNPINTYLPEEISNRLPNTSTIRVRHLLRHTSGLKDYLSVPQFWHKIKAEPNYDWQVTEMLNYIYDEPAQFEVDSRFDYSNTNYLLLGIILDGLLGYDLAIAIRQQILEPLGMTETYYYQRETLGGELVHGYEMEEDGLISYRHIKLGYRAADGGMVSTPRDLSLFFSAFGKTQAPFNAEIKTQMLDNLNIMDATREYGAGIVRKTEDSTFASLSGKVAYMHGGYNNGYMSRSYYYPKEDVSISIFYNRVFNRQTEQDKHNMVNAFREALRAKVFNEL
ncbi:serine hydrolase domain-containing protein [Pseudoalteromonas sp. R3]|uniref:serine hydrolase domain-containing protein n=1 Tax=Pseudoalteromonas sp. R3 TaxID=1709477 RepID=UPI0006B5A901|nr:serine hydrolase domain-containing protein [Pseudoalteromonas sp. R3]AZZ99289.1 class A beta-lactamase-related serine hydrolase [Pseudoalteromonas sp. R3]